MFNDTCCMIFFSQDTIVLFLIISWLNIRLNLPIYILKNVSSLNTHKFEHPECLPKKKFEHPECNDQLFLRLP